MKNLIYLKIDPSDNTLFYKRLVLTYKAARKTVFPSVPWQRCYFHLSENAQAYARKMEEKLEIAKSMRTIFSTYSKEDAKMILKNTIKYWGTEKHHSAFANWLENNVEDSFTYFDFNVAWWPKIRTSNCIERLNREIKRRTKIIGIFPNIESCERLIGAILMEKHEEWMEENAYLSVKDEKISIFCT